MKSTDSQELSPSNGITLDDFVEGDFVFPASYAQERLWFLDQLERGNATYNIPSVYRFVGKLDVSALERSLNEIIRRHEVLRTTFRVEDGQPVQVIAPSAHLSLEVADIQAIPESEREKEIKRLIREEARRPFDLAQGPLLRASLLKLAEEEHILRLTMHHIISDGWSMGIFYRELSALYTAYSTGKASPLPELVIQYADFAVWQRERLQGEILKEQLDYWKKQLTDAPPVLELPTDRVRPPVQTFSGAKHSLVLSQRLTASLKELSRREETTLFMTLLAAFEVLLYRYTRQEDIVVGSPIANRNRAEIEGLIGFFVNTLVLRSDLSGSRSFKEVLSRVRDVALEAYTHQDLPFEKLVEELEPERHMTYNPLFQVMFVLQNALGHSIELSGLTWEPVMVEMGIAKFDLTLSMVEEGESLRAVWEYNTDLFETITIERMGGHFVTLLEGIVTEPETCIGQLPLLTEAERVELLVGWNNTEIEYGTDRCLHELFEEQVKRTPEAVAVVFEDQQLTYCELNTRANQVAHYLRNQGVGPEVLVGIYVERSLEMVIGLLGILKAGGAYVPVDPEYPPERVEFMIEDTGVPIMLTHKGLEARLLERTVKVICLDRARDVLGQESGENLVSVVNADNLAYVIYTSGSTGQPKGVMIPHRAIRNHMCWMQQSFNFDGTERVLQKTPFSFDASVWEFYAPLLSGGQLIIAQPGGHRDGGYLVQTIIDHTITTLQLVPSQLQLILGIGGLEKCSSLRRVFCGGEVLPPELVAQFFSCLPDVTLYNLYGPSEATIDTTIWKCRKEDELRTVPIGRPIANVQVYILDRNLHPVPISVSGELYIGGAGVGLGYLNRPKLNTEKFIPNPFNENPDAQLYKTGDLARYLPDGNIEFLGRTDQQVKVRGFRIELGEIETVLGQYLGIRENVVVAQEDDPGEKNLVAYVVPNQKPTPSTSELRHFLKQKLPQYMLPSAFVFLDALPLTPNGKIDRRALPAHEPTRSEVESRFVGPRIPAEEIIAEIWAEVLKLQRVGIHDNFFELGGHSLLATQVISRIRDTFQVELPLRRLFEAPTVAELTEALFQASNERTKIERTAVLLLRLAQLSEDEVESMLDGLSTQETETK